MEASIRIIPALAGNTQLWATGEASGEDHPRSRGEYNFDRPYDLALIGSSPLSRGILPYGIPVPFTGRIIPALAGNTSVQFAPITFSSDHPRSRGEYGRHQADCGRPGGSSPLSRGILSPLGGILFFPGIIPALAGNTWFCGCGDGQL